MPDCLVKIKSWILSCIGTLFFQLFLKKTAVQENIQHVFGQQLSAKQQQNLTLAYFFQFMKSLIELIKICCLRQHFFCNKVIDIQGLEYFQEALQKNQGIILLTGHFGSWEWLPLLMRMLSSHTEPSNIPREFYCIRKKLRYPYLTHKIIECFQWGKINIIWREKALSKTLCALKRKGIVVFAFDLKPKENDHHAVPTLFLNQPTTSYSSLAYLAKRQNISVIPMNYYRINSKKLIVEFTPEISWQLGEEPEQERIKNTQRYNDELAKMILQHPEQWHWAYQRW